MDIFAAQLKRITTVPIRKQRGQVKALNKSSASKGLTDDLDHLENHDQYFEHSDDDKHEHVSEDDLANDGSHDKSPSIVDEGEDETLLEKNAATDNLHLDSEKDEEDEYIGSEIVPEFLAYAKKPRIPREELKQLEEAKKSLKHFDLYI